MSVFYSSSPFASIPKLSHIIICATTSICQILILYQFTSPWILKFFDYFCRLVAILVNLSLFRNCFLSTIFNHCLLTYRLTHTTTHSTKTARLERLEGATTHTSTTTHHVHLHSTAAHSSKSSTTEEIIIIVIKSHSHTKISKWISLSNFLLLIGSLFLLLTSSTHSTSHSTLHTTTHHIHSHSSHTSKSSSSSEEIIVIIKEASERVFSPKELSKYLISRLHIKMMEPRMATESTAWTSTTCMSSVNHVISSELIIFLSFFLVTQNAISKCNLFEYFFGCLGIIWVFIRVVF